MRFLNEAHDFCEERIFTDTSGSEDERTGGVEGAGADFVALAFGHDLRLTGEHRFIQIAAPGINRAINRNVFTRSHAQLIANLNFVERHIDFAPLRVEPVGDFRCQFHECADGGIGATVGALFDDLPQQDNGRDEGGRLKVEWRAMAAAQGGRKVVAIQYGKHAVEIGGTRARDGQGEHIGVERAQ